MTSTETSTLCQRGAVALNDQPNLRWDLAYFSIYWGLNAYDPPEHVVKAVRDIVTAFLADAAALSEKEG